MKDSSRRKFTEYFEFDIVDEEDVLNDIELSEVLQLAPAETLPEGVVLATKVWDESKVVRDAGKFAKKPGSGKGELPGPDDLDFDSHLGGSTGAELWKDDAGNKYVVKDGNTKGHIEAENATNKMYEATGVAVPRSEMKEGKQVAEFVDGVPLGSLKGKLRDLAIKDLQKNFAADALLANWDVVGLSEDNVIVDKDGKAHRVDNGGSLDYRAQGKKKPFGPEVNELKTMRNPSYSAGKVFGGLSDSDVAMQIKDLVDKETAILAAAPPGQKSTIVKRLAYMDKWADDVLGKEQTPAPSAWKPTGHKVADAFGKFVGKGPVTLAKPAAGKSFTGEVVDVKPQSKSSALVTLQRPDGSKYQVILGQKAASHAKGTSKSKVGKKTPLGKAIAKQKPKVQAQVATPAAVSEYTGNRTARWKALGMDKSFKTEHGVDWKAGGQPPPPVKTAWRQAAKSYTNSSFSLNKGLYSGNKLSPALKKRQKALDEYVEAHGVEKEVMRRIPPRHGSKTIERYKAALANGHDVVEPGFLSTTSGGFAQGSFVKMRIRARKALNVSSQTKHPGEQEYVLGSGQRFRVLQIEEKKGGYTTIHVEQLI